MSQKLDGLWILRVFLIGFVFRESRGMTLTDQQATVGQFPFMIYLTIQKSPDNSFSCGGSVLTQNFGLTAAHCLTFEEDNKTKLAMAAHAFMGVVDLMGPEEYEIYRKVSEMIVHENYQIFGDQDYTFHDIALVRFESPLTFCDRVQPITLPKYVKRMYTGTIVTGMGWGMTNSGLTSTDLLYAFSRVISNVKCQKKYNRSTKLSYDVTDGMICVTPTGDNPRGGACMGDSGGPIVVRNTTVIVGIASWTEVHDNCTKPFPDAFTRVTHYLDWIQTKVGGDEAWFLFGTNITNECAKEVVWDEIDGGTIIGTGEEINAPVADKISGISVYNEITTEIVMK